jgi:hypothetical protein
VVRVRFPGVRYWTVDEARAYLPRLRQLVETVRGAVSTAATAKGNGHGKAAGANPVSIRKALEEIEAGDIVMRDPSTGLIDFHAKGADGVVYFLCWRLDEDDLGWWHLPEEGFAGRKPLPREP